MIDVASGLEYLHHDYSNPVVHCDLKPSNILLDDDMVAHISDFGIAKLLMGNEFMKRTKTLGTIGYMAPGKVSNNFNTFIYYNDMNLCHFFLSQLAGFPFDQQALVGIKVLHNEQLILHAGSKLEDKLLQVF